jgi:putative sigma-54 modulation protein
MQINLTGHHIDITDSLRSYVDEKMERIERHFDKVTNTHVILTVEGNRHKAEATISMRGNNVFAESTEENMYTAIDNLVDKLDRQVKKHKEKITDHHQKEEPPQPLTDEAE